MGNGIAAVEVSFIHKCPSKKKGDCPNYCSLASFGDLELLRLFLATNNGSGLSPPKGNFVAVMRDTHHRI
jgi:hypothetical protein